VGQGKKGPQVSEILEIDESTAVVAPTPTPGKRSSAGRAADGSATRMTGTVKWYNSEKRFGFVPVEGGRSEVFVHVAALQRSGIAKLSAASGSRWKSPRGKRA